MIGNELLAAAVKKLGSQSEVARRIGMTRGSVSEMVRGKSAVTLRTALFLADILGVDWGEVIRAYTGLGEVRP